MAEYQTIKAVVRSQTTLALKYRIDGGYPCVVWREQRGDSNQNRRFYREDGKFWSIPAELALEMLNDAEKMGLLIPDYFRWPDHDIEVLDTATLNQDEKNTLIKETLVNDIEDDFWRHCDDLRIVTCVEPGNQEWRKIMIVSKSKNRVTFRSTTRSSYYSFLEKYTLHSDWKLDKSMMDADGKIQQIFLDVLRRVLAD